MQLDFQKALGKVTVDLSRRASRQGTECFIVEQKLSSDKNITMRDFNSWKLLLGYLKDTKTVRVDNWVG